MVGPGDIATPLQLSMWWDITSLVQSVGLNLICVKKSITLIGLTMFFFASTAESRATFQKLVLDRVSKFGWIKNLLQLCFLKFKVVLSFFLNL